MEAPKSLTLPDLLDEMAVRHPFKEALVFMDQRYTYEQFQKEVNKIAKGLIKLGLKKGDKVSMLFNNRIEWMLLAFGILKAGGVFVAINTWYRDRELEYALKHSESKMLFVVDQFLKSNYLDMLRQLFPIIDQKLPDELSFDKLPNFKYIISLGETAKGTLSWKKFLEMGKTISDQKLALLQSQINQQDVAMILYTSGTTSRPKAVQLLNKGLIENGFNIGERQHQTVDDVLWVGIPMFFSFFSANAMMTILTHGGSIVIQEFFNPEEAIRLISMEKCTVFYGMPNMTTAIYNFSAREDYDISSLRTGASIGPPEAIRFTAELIPKICNVYGLTETYGNCVVCDAEDPLELRCNSQGKPLPGNEIKIVDPQTGKQLPSGKVGEVCVKGYVTPGYYKDPENNTRAFDDEGYFHTGDLGSVDEDKQFYYVARSKDMIKSGGINVSPAEVEDFLYTHPKVKEVNVISFPDELKGEVVMAVLELRKGTNATEEEIIEYCKGKIAGYSVPKHVRFIEGDKWPRTASGKVPKDDLRKLMLSTKYFKLS